MTKYQPGEIEEKWQKKWEEKKLYKAKDLLVDKKKYYILVEFPYPSGDRLHVGHARSYMAMDALSRKKRMQGFNVLYPIGWDAFGLPAENYAIKSGIHPKITTEKNIANAKKQVKSWGLSFDWEREINTSDPKYYKWTQWIFLKLLKNNMAYQADVSVNWCPSCKTNLANEEVLEDGTHERCGLKTEKRMQKQWLLRITKYADRFLEGLKEVDYPDKVRIQQENWIGKSKGTEIIFKTKDNKQQIPVFTTRPDTLFGVTALVVAPEHKILISVPKSHKNEVEEYIKQAKKKTEIERLATDKEKTGVFTGLFAVNPVNNEKIPVWVGDYVLGWYGKAAVMVVPAHDQRDYMFAKKNRLAIRQVITGGNIKKQAYEKEGKLINSEKFNGQESTQARKSITQWLTKHNSGSESVQYKLRDWVFSRQHYWGEPIPVVHCQKCGVVGVSEKDLPIELPHVEDFKPLGTGKSPLEKVTFWVNTKCPKCNGNAKRETDTMPNWAGSNWYYLRYLDPNNDREFADKEKMKYWMPVDIYQGGFEHTTLHLLYSRFIYQFLYDIKEVLTKEPYAKRRVHGIVLGTDGRKMSKSFGNVINPDEIINKFGADTLRIYESFMGPFDQTISWSEERVEGCFRFLKRVCQLADKKVSKENTSKELLILLHKTIKKVSEDLENFKFNTAIASMMEFINSWQQDEKGLSKKDLEKFLLILAPFAPHLTEEIWQTKLSTANKFVSIHEQKWPEFDKELLIKDKINIVVQVNGKVRDTVVCEKANAKNKKKIEEDVKKSSKIKQHLLGKAIKRVVYIEGRVLNFVTD